MEVREADAHLDRDPQDGTAAVESQYLQMTTIHGRDFQTYSINHSVHFVPVDEVDTHLPLVGSMQDGRLKD